MNAEDVLFVLAHRAPVDLDGLTFAVITKPSDHAWDQANQQLVERKSWWPFDPGEVLVLDRWGREPFGEGRKPGKWGVTCEIFDSLDAALERRAQVLSDGGSDDT